MFISLLAATFVIALVVAIIIAKLCDGSIHRILARIVRDDISDAWHRYLKFAIIVVGLSGGVRLWELEQYIRQGLGTEAPKVLTTDRWVLEIYSTIIGTLQSVAWMLLLFFLVSLIAYIIVRGQERRAESQTPKAKSTEPEVVI